MDKLRVILVDALIGAVVFGVAFGVYEFGFAGPAYEAASTDSSVRGMWPIVGFFATLFAAAAGAVAGAIVAAVRIARGK